MLPLPSEVSQDRIVAHSASSRKWPPVCLKAPQGRNALGPSKRPPKNVGGGGGLGAKRECKQSQLVQLRDRGMQVSQLLGTCTLGRKGLGSTKSATRGWLFSMVPLVVGFRKKAIDL